MAKRVARSSADTSSEHASAVACSAFCNDIREDVCILSVIVAIGKLSQVQRQIGLADVMERAHHATLEQAPKAIQVRSMDVPAHIFAFVVIDDMMRKGASKTVVPRSFIGRDQRDILTHRLPDKVAQGESVCILDDLAHDVPLTGNGPNHADFPAADPCGMRPFAHVPVLIFSANVRLIHFHFSHQFPKPSVSHRRSDAMAHIPSSFIGSASDHALNLQCANALLALENQENDLKPRPQWVIRILKNCLANDGEAIAVPPPACLGLADPVKRASLQCIHFLIVAAWTLHAVRPTLLLQKLFAGFFGGEAVHGFGKCEFGFHDGLRDVEAIVHKC
jgi:hypothetical protein